MRAERRRRKGEAAGWTWSHVAVLAAVFITLGVVAWNVAHG